MKEENKNQLNIELPESLANGTYANLAIIAHSSSEFVIDFVRVMPNAPKSKVQSRIILNAENAKRLLNALQDNVNKYEQQYGTIHLPEQKRAFPVNFRDCQGEA